MTECHDVNFSYNLIALIQVWLLFATCAICIKCQRFYSSIIINIIITLLMIAGMILVYVGRMVQYCEGKNNTWYWIYTSLTPVLPLLLCFCHTCCDYNDELDDRSEGEEEVVIEVHKLGEPDH